MPRPFSTYNTRKKISKKEIYSLLSYIKDNLNHNSLKKILEKYAQRQNSDIQILTMEIIEHIEQGNTFSAYIKKLNILPKYTVNLLLYAEEIGQLQTGLSQVITYRQNKIRQKRSLINSLLYPAIITIACFVLFTAFLLYFIPLLISNFEDLDITIPKTFLLLGALSSLIKSYYFILIPCTLTITTIPLYYLLFKQENLINISSRTPLLRRIVNFWDRYQLFNNLKLAIASDSQINHAIKNIKELLISKQSQKDITKVQIRLFEGQSLSDAIKDTIFFTNEIEMRLKQGEEAENLPEAISNIEEDITEKFKFYLGIIKKTSEPLIIVIIGSLVFSLLWLFMMPISSIMNNIGF